ncbi:hypothetical protein QBC33DRAFT_541600 [Phialemonium atrogriseum]|uniref:Zn(2)-C6 fungal-type domain-containing protein n=1 Tax=Phialemonium atrogriseum TaxID=1093897 RepID=A0AAJ0C2W7_9PEZI|nr:uncharacterized protein QBC33DRAFT_541600 [Phialemonium atrogriseum]KAK1766626.1 hypothetical protein QBC33DRAFT_541600 [Phialemonium atrogriseum]
MLRADPSTGSCFSEFKPGPGIVKPPRRERPHQLACDRCKGQKLRCIRSPNLRAPCERCQKAGATCIIDLSVRMGRPKRADKDQRGSTASSNPPQPTRSPTLPSTSHTAAGGFTPNGDTWSGHDLDDTPDPTLQGVQYLEFFDIALQDATPEDESLDRPAEHYLDPTLDLSLAQSIPTLITLTDEGTAVDTATVNAYSRFPPMRQDSTQELSNLNLELYRQLGVVGSMASKDANIHPGLATPPGGTHTSLSDAVVFMMHGLQTYHRLLVEILGFTGPTHDAMHCSHDHPKPSTTSLLSPADGMDSEDPRGPVSEAATSRQPRLASQSDGSSELTVAHDPSHGASALLDMPTSLLLLSCHANLIYFCRDAFAAIRAALLATRRPITLFSISFLHTDEVSIPQDPDLQIIVLTQAVIRLIERIGRLLGYPDDWEDDSGHERCEPNLRSHNNAIPPELLDLVLRRAASGEGPLDRVGIRELREEIRRLYELVYRPV